MSAPTYEKSAPGFSATSRFMHALVLVFLLTGATGAAETPGAASLKIVTAMQMSTGRPPVDSAGGETGADENATEAAAVVLNDGFEGAFPGSWNVFDGNGSANGNVFWNTTTFRKFSGDRSAGASLGGPDAVAPGANYPNNMFSWMIYGPFDLSDADAGTFSFRFWLDSEPDDDSLFWGVSLDGSSFNGNGASGQTPGWVFQSLDLTNIAGLGDVTGESSVYIAFVFSSDASVTAEGAYVDTVKITKSTSATTADLKLRLVDAPAGTFAPGDSMDVFNRTRNIGSETSTPYRITFYASTNADITASDIYLGHIDRTALDPGADHDRITVVALPGDIPEGDYYIGAILEVVDADAANNVNHDPTPISVLLALDPDIHITPLTLNFSQSMAGDPGEDEGAAGGVVGDHDDGADQQAAPGRDLNIYMRKGTVEPGPFVTGSAQGDARLTEYAQGHRVMQFDRIPTREQREELAAAGIRLLEYLPNNAYWVSVSRSVSTVTAERIAGKVLRVWEPEPGYKLSEEITDGAIPAYASHADGTVEVQVLLFEDVARDTAITALQSTARVEIIAWQSDTLVTLRLPEDALPLVAALDLVHWVEPRPPRNVSDNQTAAARIQADIIRAPPWALKGRGVKVGVWDGGTVFPHDDFGTRLTIRDPVDVSSHATHVAGTIGGSGAGNINARGMAPLVRLHSYDWDDDQMEMRATVVPISNHSYGFITGWSWNPDTEMWEDNANSANFGRYNATTAAWDDIIADTGLIVFKSAGNDRDDGPDCPAGPRCDGQFDSIGIRATAKNVLTICATDDSDVMSSFSSWGPVNDGRIKPDLCANGVGLTSTYPDAESDAVGGTSMATGPDAEYASISGTSMATPSVAGTAALLHEQFVSETGGEPAPHTLKALLIHGATDLGRPGPDYEHGWGLVNALETANLIAGGAYTVGSIANQGAIQSYQVTVPAGASELKATLVWTDPAGSPAAARALVNNLNLVLIAPDDSKRFPWGLDAGVPTKNAGRGVNQVDNVEQVLVRNPTAGVWTVRVTGAAVPMGPQEFALVTEGFGSSGQFTIFNEGDAPLTINSMSLGSPAAWISWSPLAPFTIPAGQSQSVTVSIDFALAPVGISKRRLLVTSNDPDESPYPGGVFIIVDKPAVICYALTLKHTGMGQDPVAAPTASKGCPAGKYIAGQVVNMTAGPADQWFVDRWGGTDNNASKALTNKVTMPAAAHTATVHYTSSCDYTVSQPNGGELWIKGNVYSINWSRTGGDCAATAKLLLYKRGLLTRTINAGTSDKTFAWTVPFGVASGNDYRVKVSDATKPKYFDTSDMNFTIKGPAEVLGVPTNVQATDGVYPDRVEVSWMAVPNATIYRIYRCTKPNSGCVVAGTSKGTSFNDTGGDAGEIYHYRVQACKPGLCGAISDSDEGHRALVFNADDYVGVALVHDINQNDSEDIAGLTTTKGGAPLVVIVDSRTRVKLRSRTYLNDGFEPVAVDSADQYIVVMARNRVSDQIVAQARDADTGALLWTITAISFPLGDTIVP